MKEMSRWVPVCLTSSAFENASRRFTVDFFGLKLDGPLF